MKENPRLLSRSKFLECVREKAEDQPLILYGAGIDAVWAIEEWEKRYGKRFLGWICDGDERKQGMKLDGREIISPSEAFRRYPEAPIYITAREYRFEIMGSLVEERHISPNRIINYEPIKKKRGCLYAEKLFFVAENIKKGFVNKLMCVCCDTHVRPFRVFRGYEFLAEDFCTFRDSIVDAIEKNKEPNACRECYGIRESWFAADRKIRTYNYATDGVCNFHCAYCRANLLFKSSSEWNVDFSRILRIFEKRGLVGDDLHIDLASGELCVNPNRRTIMDMSARYAGSISVATNASVFDSQLYELLCSGRASLVVSLDSGTKETFAAIKKVDCFSTVIRNLMKYRKSGNGSVELKYIFLPGINDNPVNIDSFISICKDIQPAIVTISFDYWYRGVVGTDTVDNIQRLKKGLERNGIFYKYQARVAKILEE